jgi:hypothetical protein
MSARRQCEGVPEMWVTPAAAHRAKNFAGGSWGQDKTSVDPLSTARR